MTPTQPSTKVPFDVYPISLSISPVFGTDAVSVNIVAIDTNTNAVSSAIVVTSGINAPIVSAGSVIFWVQGGKVGDVYRLGVQITDTCAISCTAPGFRQEGDIQLLVKATR